MPLQVVFITIRLPTWGLGAMLLVPWFTSGAYLTVRAFRGRYPGYTPQMELFRSGMVVLSLGLLGLGVAAIAFPELSSVGYGVQGEPAWVAATGLRDIALGLMAAGLLLRAPSALRVFLPTLILVPLGDVAFVLLWGDSVLGIAPHALGAIYITGLSMLASRSVPPLSPR